MKKEYTYDAFISYRHSDLDKFVAENIHKLLETYKLPKNIIKKYNLEKNNVKRVFRDKEELPLTSNLEDPIIKALENSEYLIVICSPRLKESMWCKREIETFINLHGRDHVLAVLIEGEPNESFPDELLYVEEKQETVNGKIKINKRCVEPLAADVRGESKKVILKNLKTEILRLLAPMFELNYDDLRQRHRERKMRKLFITSTAIAVGCLLFSLYSAFMLIKINKQQTMLKKDQAINLADQAFEYLEKDDRRKAIQTAYQALTKYHDVNMPYTAKAEYALSESLNVYDIGISNESMYQMETNAIISNMKVSPNKELLLTYARSATLVLWDIKTGKKIMIFDDVNGLEFSQYTYSFVGDDYFIYGNEDNEIVVVETKEGKIQKKIKSDNIYAISSKLDGSLFAVSSDNKVTIYDGKTYEETKTFDSGNESIMLDHFFASDNNYFMYAIRKGSILDENTSFNLHIVDTNSKTEQNEIVIDGEYLSKIVTKGDYAYILSNYGSNNKYIMYLTKINLKTGEKLYTKTYNGEFGTMMEISATTNNITIVSSFTAHMINGDTGELIADSSIGDAVVGLMTVRNSDLFLIITREGKNYVLQPQKGDTTSFGTLFTMNCEYSSVVVSNYGYLAISTMDNRVILYNYYDNENLKEVNEEYELPSEIGMEEQEQIKNDWNFSKKNLVSDVTYNDSKDKLFVSYTDSTLEVYNVKDKKLIKTITDVESGLSYYFGETKDGNIVIGSRIVSYIINKDYDVLAKIENLRAIDKDKNMIYVEKNDKFYSMSIYSVKELIELAESYE